MLTLGNTMTDNLAYQTLPFRPCPPEVVSCLKSVLRGFDVCTHTTIETSKVYQLEYSPATWEAVTL